MTKLTAPRHGSLGYGPRKRAIKQSFSPRTWVQKEGKQVLGFAGYKAGMTQVSAIDKRKSSPSFERKLMLAATIIECPPIHVFGVRGYTKTVYGRKALGDIWEPKPNKNLARKTNTPKKPQEKLPELSTASEIRLLVHTQPTFKKTPEVFEIAVSGGMPEALEFAKSVLGKDIKVSDVLADGDYVDVVAVTKGKGLQGPVKRWGTRIQYRKAHGKRRHVGSINPWSPSRIMWTSLMPGQMGYHKRTDINKRILKIGENGDEVTPKGGIVNYGKVKGDYIVLKGSVPGPKKRAIMIRFAARPPRTGTEMPEVTGVSTRSNQGRAKK